MPIPLEAILASLDVLSLHTNIPHDEGIAAIREATQLSDIARVDSEMTAELTKVVCYRTTPFILWENICCRNKAQLWEPEWPLAYANVFNGKVERQWQVLAPHGKIVTWFRFIDDIFLIWNVSEDELNQFMIDCNQILRSLVCNRTLRSPF